MASCQHCHQESDALIMVAGHEVCRTCIETLSADSGGNARRRLVRRRTGKQVAGVCAGLGEWLEVEVDTIRVITIIATCITGFVPGFVIYAILTVFLPVED